MPKSRASKMLKGFYFVVRMPSLFLITIISLYQKTISPDHGSFGRFYSNGFCRYYPSCSQYAKDALEKYGFFRGVALSFWRLLRCNPWSKGGVDMVE